MIEKQRLEELIEQGATIYGINCFGTIEKIDLRSIMYRKIGDWLYKINTAKYGSGLDDVYEEKMDRFGSDCLFETEEDAEFELKYQNITRIETLSLPTWEEIQKIERFDFNAKDGHRYVLHYLEGFKTLAIVGIIENKFYGNATKENYIEACKVAKKLFLGE